MDVNAAFYIKAFIHIFYRLQGEGNVFTDVCHSVHNRSHGYSFTAHPCYYFLVPENVGVVFSRSHICTGFCQIKSAENFRDNTLNSDYFTYFYLYFKQRYISQMEN